jgi:hypothetical protein
MALGLTERESDARKVLASLANRKHSGVHVQVLPTQAEDLAAPQTCAHGEMH